MQHTTKFDKYDDDESTLESNDTSVDSFHIRSSITFQEVVATKQTLLFKGLVEC